MADNRRAPLAGMQLLRKEAKVMWKSVKVAAKKEEEEEMVA